MPFGNDYARLYDALYQKKNYMAECDFLEQVFRKYSSHPVHSILELGCGTGGHALPLVRRGYQVTGVDRSEQMLEAARAKIVLSEYANPPTFHRDDIRELDLGRTFDAVIAMFAVMSYMTSNDDLTRALRVARRHLSPGGLFFFDAWSGLAVLRERPADRYKIVTAGNEQIIRFAHPELDLLHHTVQVNYKVLKLKGERVVGEANEAHTVRFFFPQELTHYLEESGFNVVKLCPFMDMERELMEADWNVAVVAEAR